MKSAYSNIGSIFSKGINASAEFVLFLTLHNLLLLGEG